MCGASGLIENDHRVRCGYGYRVGRGEALWLRGITVHSRWVLDVVSREQLEGDVIEQWVAPGTHTFSPISPEGNLEGFAFPGLRRRARATLGIRKSETRAGLCSISCQRPARRVPTTCC